MLPCNKKRAIDFKPASVHVVLFVTGCAVSAAELEFFSFYFLDNAAFEHFAAAVRAYGQVRFDRDFDQSAEAAEHLLGEGFSFFGEHKRGFVPVILASCCLDKTVLFKLGKERVHLSCGNFFVEAFADFFHELIAMVFFFQQQQYRIEFDHVRDFGLCHSGMVREKV